MDSIIFFYFLFYFVGELRRRRDSSLEKLASSGFQRCFGLFPGCAVAVDESAVVGWLLAYSIVTRWKLKKGTFSR